MLTLILSRTFVNPAKAKPRFSFCSYGHGKHSPPKQGLDELRDEILMLEMQLKSMTRVAPYASITIKRLQAMMREDVDFLKEDIVSIQSDLQKFTDVKKFKRWLNLYSIPADVPDIEDLILAGLIPGDFPSSKKK